MKKILFAGLLLIFIVGCASPRWLIIEETEEGIEFRSNDKFSAEYEKNEKGEIKAKADTKSKPLFNIGMPDVEVK